MDFDDAGLASALRQLSRARRRNRAADVDVFEGFYQAYLTAFGCAVGVLLGSDAIGDLKATTQQAASVEAHGPAIIGLIIAAALFVALRSGARGGPLVLPAADVRHVLLAPIPRTLALRSPAIRQLRFASFVGAVGGAGLATIAARRLPGGVSEWAPIGGAVGLVIAVLVTGVGLVACGRRLRPWLGGLIGVAILGWAVADLELHVITSPTSLLGQLALSALKFHPADLAIVVLPLALAVVAVLGIGELSIEQAERRATLASQIRFALTLQDLRTVVLLRRQLTQEQSRTRPWIRLKPVFGGRNLVLRRDVRGVLRWPTVRVFRVVFLGVTAGACMVGVWDGTTPLIVIAALCLFLAGLDALEPLAQEVDHGWATAIAITGGSHTAITVGAAMLVPAALLAMIGAAASVVMEPTAGGSDFLPAEIASIKLVVRAIWAPGLVIIGLTPILLARTATHHHVSAAAEALNAGFLPMMVGVLGLGWLRFREDIHLYFKMPAKEG
jgi:hypothetical protein